MRWLMVEYVTLHASAICCWVYACENISKIINSAGGIYGIVVKRSIQQVTDYINMKNIYFTLCHIYDLPPFDPYIHLPHIKKQKTWQAHTLIK